VQSTAYLRSYGSDGTLRWSADDLGCLASNVTVPAPTLLSGDELVVPCRSGNALRDDLCWVAALNGELIWRSKINETVVGSPAVGSGGVIYVETLSGLVALQNDRVGLQAGETETVSFELDDDDFMYWSEEEKGWAVEAGTFEIQVGSSSKDIRLTTTVEVN